MKKKFQNLTMQQAFCGWLLLGFLYVCAWVLLPTLGMLEHRIVFRTSFLYGQARKAIVAEVDSFTKIPSPPTVYPWFRRSGAICIAVPRKAPQKIFPLSQDEPIGTVYEAMDYVHSVGDGQGTVELERGSIRRGKRLWYLGCDPQMGGHCWPGVQLTLKREDLVR